MADGNIKDYRPHQVVGWSTYSCPKCGQPTRTPTRFNLAVGRSRKCRLQSYPRRRHLC